MAYTLPPTRPELSLEEEEREYEAWTDGESETDDDGNIGDITDSNDLNFGKSKTVPLGLMTKYAPRWTRQDGFREVYQNWRDGMLKSFNIPYDKFRVKFTETKHMILIQAFTLEKPARPSELCGYMKFKWDKNDLGILELTNFKASLQLWHLALGGTSKADDKEQAGQHGEGLKLSALTFRRYPYKHSFRIESREIRWSFNFNIERQLACKLTQVGREKILRAKRAARQQKSRTATSRIWEDVSVIIGAPIKGRGSNGKTLKGEKIPLAEFREWLKITTDVEGPDSILRTGCGDLITDKQYSNKLYLRGLLLPHGSLTGKSCVYGYNFLEGKTNRDRQALGNVNEEIRNINTIWAKALHTAGPGSELLSTYTNLVLEHLNKVGDVMLMAKGQSLDEGTARMVWGQMKSINQDDQGRSAFYYHPTDGKDDVHMIYRNLRRHPFPIDIQLWEILRSFKLCRTPTEEQQHRFAKSRRAEVPDNSFANHMEWMLKCCSQSHSPTRNMDIEFVKGSGLGIDVAYFAPIFKIHEKWLNYDVVHKESLCEENAPSNNEPFSCDHTILDLWELMLYQLDASGYKEVARHESGLRGMARFRLPQIPRRITCVPTDKRGELRVAWDSMESHRNLGKPVRVILHTDECTNEPKDSQNNPVNSMFNKKDQDPQCGCISQISTVGIGGVVFTGLDPTKGYYPKVSRDIDGAFFGVHPSSVHPNSEDDIQSENTASAKRRANSAKDPGSSGDSVMIGDPQDNFASATSGPAARRQSVALSISSDDSNGDYFNSNQNSDEVYSNDSRGPCDGSSLSASQPRRRSNHHNRSTTETHVLGEGIPHNELAWGDGFPSSHNFYRTRDAPEDGVLIAKPKPANPNNNGKRATTGASGKTSKRVRNEPLF